MNLKKILKKTLEKMLGDEHPEEWDRIVTKVPGAKMPATRYYYMNDYINGKRSMYQIAKKVYKKETYSGAMTSKTVKDFYINSAIGELYALRDRKYIRIT